jgi:hypothetical protein
MANSMRVIWCKNIFANSQKRLQKWIRVKNKYDNQEAICREAAPGTV